jgi:toxin ParE1/3/4
VTSRRLILSPASRRDLLLIGDYIAQDNPARARTFVGEIEGKMREAASRPATFPRRPDLSRGLHVARHRHYLIFFTFDDREVRVERVLHGARDLSWALRED